MRGAAEKAPSAAATSSASTLRSSEARRGVAASLDSGGVGGRAAMSVMRSACHGCGELAESEEFLPAYDPTRQTPAWTWAETDTPRVRPLRAGREHGGIPDERGANRAAPCVWIS